MSNPYGGPPGSPGDREPGEPYPPYSGSSYGGDAFICYRERIDGDDLEQPIVD